MRPRPIEETRSELVPSVRWSMDPPRDLYPARIARRGQRSLSAIEAVVFDIAGVVMDSPLFAIAGYERDHGLAPNSINRVVVASGEGGAWARLERGELTVETFIVPFEADCRAQGLAVDGRAPMAVVAQARAPRPQMIEAIRRIRARGLRT